MNRLSFYPWALERSDRQTQNRSMAKSTPSSNILKNNEGYIVEVAVPGYTKDDIEIEISENKLTIKGNKEMVSEENEKFVMKEFVKGSFSVSYTLGEAIAKSSVSAEVESGILKITLPFKEEAKNDTFKIAVK